MKNLGNLNWQALALAAVILLTVVAIIKASTSGNGNLDATALAPLGILFVIFLLGGANSLKLPRHGGTLLVAALLSGLLLFFPLASISWLYPLGIAFLVFLFL